MGGGDLKPEMSHVNNKRVRKLIEVMKGPFSVWNLCFKLQAELINF